MKKIKIDKQQDKQIRKSIKESLTEVNGLDPNGGELTLHYEKPGKEPPTTAAEIGQTAIDATKAGERVSNNSNVNGKVSFKADTDGDKHPQEVTVSADNMEESVIISKGQLDEIRLKKLKENSEMVKIENFLK